MARSIAVTRTDHEAAEQCGMERQTLRDWVHRYNAEGVAGRAARLFRPAAGIEREADR